MGIAQRLYEQRCRSHMHGPYSVPPSTRSHAVSRAATYLITQVLWALVLTVTAMLPLL